MDLSGLKSIVQELTKSAGERAISKALKLYSKGDLARAIEVLKEAQRASPEDPRILMDLGRLLGLAGRGAEGAEAFRSILRKDPKALARVTETIEEIRARNPSVGPLYDALVEHYIRHDDFKAAYEALERMKPEEIRAAASRHLVKWDGLRKNARGGKMPRTSMLSAYHLALGYEVQRDYSKAAEIYRTLAGADPEEMGHLLPRLESLAAKDYQNAALRVVIADLLLKGERCEEATKHFSLAIQTDERAARAVAERLTAYLQVKGDQPALRFVLVEALQASGEPGPVLKALAPLVEAGADLDRVVGILEPMTAGEKCGPARRLLATALMRRGQPQQALEMLVQVAEEEGLKEIEGPLLALVEAHPDLARAHHILADVHLTEKRAVQGVASLRKALELAPGESGIVVAKLIRALEIDPGSADAHLLLADLQAKAGQTEQAIVLLRHLVRTIPGKAEEALAQLTPLLGTESGRPPRAAIGAAECCIELKRFEDALDYLKQVASDHPGLTAEFLHNTGLLAEAAPSLCAPIAEMLRALEPRSPHPQAVRFTRAEALLRGGDPAAAATELNEVLRAAPGRSEEVRQVLERFDRDDPRAAEARFLLASLYLDRRDHASALVELSRHGAANPMLLDRVLAKYETILAGAPDDCEARTGLVRTLLLRRDHDRVIEVGQETLKIRDDASTAWVSLAMGEAFQERGQSDAAAARLHAAYRADRSLLDEVVRRLKALIEVEGTHAQGSLFLGQVMAAEGRAAEAVAALRAARAADPSLRDTVLEELQALMATCPTEPQAGLWTVAMLMEKGETRQAIRVVSSLLDAHPDLAPILAGHLDQILKVSPDQPFALYEMGRALQRMKKYPKSVASLYAAFRHDPSLAPMALKRLREVVEAAPTCLDGHLATCAIHAARGKPLAAAEAVKVALQKVPDAADRLLPRLEELCSREPGNAHIAMILAETCLRAGQHAKALAAYDEAVRADPALLDAAFEGFEALVKANPKMGQAYLSRGRAHARRLRIEDAVRDLAQAGRLDPHLLPSALQAVEEMRSRHPESAACALVLADLWLAAGDSNQATSLLEAENRRGRESPERLSILMRLWSLAVGRDDQAAARVFMDQAMRLTKDRARLLAQVHETHLVALRAELTRLRRTLSDGSPQPSDREAAVRLLLDLGDPDQAEALLETEAAGFEGDQADRLRAEIALRRGDYVRASEMLTRLAPSRALAFGASRAGDHGLAIRTLEQLAKERPDPDVRASLDRLYREMIAADLLGASRRLQAETILTFGDGAAA
jgi:tetratricopeptide (TPR) repeat protein